MRTILERERPWIEVFHPEDYALSQTWVRHAKPSPMSLPIEKYLDVDPAVRYRLRAEWNRPIRWPALALLLVAAAVAGPGMRRAWRSRRP
jgi:hypothetical protein